MVQPPRVLLVQPPIYDFAAFDLFVYPLGLLELGASLEAAGCRVTLVDALDRYDLSLNSIVKPTKPPTFRGDGCGHFPRERIEPPAALAKIPRRFHRFGLPAPTLRERIAAAGRPDLVGITCTMTYWYPGVREVVSHVRALFGDLPVVLGGVYATLCADHARANTGVDLVIAGRDPTPLLRELGLDSIQGPEAPLPAHHLLDHRESAALRTSHGCPYRCTYCAAHLIAGAFCRRPVDAVIRELTGLVRARRRRHVAFHDDALITGRGDAFIDLASRIKEQGLNSSAAFYSINGLNAAVLSGEVAGALRESGFRALRIGFETTDLDLQARTGAKVTGDDLARGLSNLFEAGFSRREVGVYVLAGLPGQEADSIEETIRYVNALGAQVRLAEYAPVPHTALFDDARRLSRLDLDEPLLHNKCLAAFRFESLDPARLRKLKDLAHGLNRALLAGETGKSA